MAKVKTATRALKPKTRPRATPMSKSKATRATPASKSKATSKPKPKTKPVTKATSTAKDASKQPARAKRAASHAQNEASAPATPVLRSLRSCIYQVTDLARAKAFYTEALGKPPYFDEPYYVGFDVDGHELGLDPDVSSRAPGGGGAVGYWRVDDINAAWQHLTTIGATSVELPHAVGVDLQTSIVADPFGNYIGLIQGA